MTPEKIQERLQSLKAEFASGQKMLSELETKEANLRNTLLRISGAIQVLEELLDNEAPIENGQQAEAKLDAMPFDGAIGSS